jgi:hypothetical protein
MRNTRTTRKGDPFMSSMQRLVGRGKKTRRLGKVEVIERADYEALELDTNVELILGLMHVEGVLAEEVRQLAGDKYARKGEAQVGRRHGANLGSVGLAGQRVGRSVCRGCAASAARSRCAATGRFMGVRARLTSGFCAGCFS